MNLLSCSSFRLGSPCVGQRDSVVVLVSFASIQYFLRVAGCLASVFISSKSNVGLFFAIVVTQLPCSKTMSTQLPPETPSTKSLFDIPMQRIVIEGATAVSKMKIKALWKCVVPMVYARIAAIMVKPGCLKIQVSIL